MWQQMKMDSMLDVMLPWAGGGGGGLHLGPRVRYMATKWYNINVSRGGDGVVYAAPPPLQFPKKKHTQPVPR